jgi:hypothetical protein
MKSINRKPPLPHSIKQPKTNTLRKSKSSTNLSEMSESFSFVRSKSMPNICGKFILTNSTCVAIDIVSQHGNTSHPASVLAIEDILTSHVYGLIIQTVVSQLFRFI